VGQGGFRVEDRSFALGGRKRSCVFVLFGGVFVALVVLGALDFR